MKKFSVMKKTARDRKADFNVSPITHTIQDETTPIKPRRKTSRRDQGGDVHTTTRSSTPNRLPTSSLNSSMNSPSYLFPYSQENCPDVIWDYTSPKLPKGSKKRDIKITVDEFLKNLSQHKVPECNTQTSHYIKLLEKWMTKQNTPMQNTPMRVKKSPINVRRNNKKRSKRVIQEIKEFMESIKVKNEENSVENKEKEVVAEEKIADAESNKSLNCPLNKMSFLQGDTNENDSTEELWGEADNSFIIKATQQLEFSYSPQDNNFDKNVGIISTIPETIANIPGAPKNANQYVSKNEQNPFNSEVEEHAQILLTQIISCDWDSGSDDDLDNCFIAEDDVLSRIPDEVLCGTDSNSSENFKANDNIVKQCSNVTPEKNDCENKQTSENISRKILFDSSKTASCTSKDMNSSKQPLMSNIRNENRSVEISFGCQKSETLYQTLNTSEAEIFNNFEDESFGDESILCQPEVLSWIDEVENQLTQSQRCTPEEIEKKKDEAIQRRKKNRSRNKID